MQNSKWILDTNVPFLLREFLISKGIPCATAQEHGWGELKNGELVKAAFDSCFVDTRLRSRNGAGPVDEFKHLSTGSLNLCLSKNQNPPLVG